MNPLGPYADAVVTLRHWQPPTDEQDTLRDAFLEFLDTHEDGCLRSCVPGHITASVVILDLAKEHCALTLHARIGAWLQPGGHCEPSDKTLATTALREATEESGITGLEIDPKPLLLDLHSLTCSLGVPTKHLDVRFLVKAPVNAELVSSQESLDLRWWPIDKLPNQTLTELVAAGVARACG